jgi:membrane-associated phospholipid phosphatase
MDGFCKNSLDDAIPSTWVKNHRWSSAHLTLRFGRQQDRACLHCPYSLFIKVAPQGVRSSRMIQEPWFPDWNYRALQALFHFVPHGRGTDKLFNFLVFDHLVSTWIFAAAFYVFWTIDDSRTACRRIRLFQIVLAFAIAVLITLIIRPWIAWPAPVLNPAFRDLYPTYFWNNGNSNCFPSHATLAYFMVAVGLWPLNRRVSVALSVVVLALISLPRVYLGGHYPIDILASLVLVIAVLGLVWRCPIPSPLVDWLNRKAAEATVRKFLLILWVFELGEGFGGSSTILNKVAHYLSR